MGTLNSVQMGNCGCRSSPEEEAKRQEERERQIEAKKDLKDPPIRVVFHWAHNDCERDMMVRPNDPSHEWLPRLISMCVPEGVIPEGYLPGEVNLEFSGVMISGGECLQQHGALITWVPLTKCAHSTPKPVTIREWCLTFSSGVVADARLDIMLNSNAFEARKATELAAAQAVPKAFGRDEKYHSRLYCGRYIGRDHLPGSDGYCGTSNGPNCEACKASAPFGASKNDEGYTVAWGRNYEYHTVLYCGRKLGRTAIPGSDGRCGPSNGPQCKSCFRLQNH